MSMVSPTRAPTVEDGSVMSSTVAVVRPAETTRPTRPAPLTTVMSGRTPASVPASMVTVLEKDCAGPQPTTRLGTRL